MQPRTGATPKTLVEEDEHDTLMALGFPAPPVGKAQLEGDAQLVGKARAPKHNRALLREFAEEERGAVTAEYALIIMAAVAFAGLLITILRSDEVRAMLVNLVQTALGSAG